MADFLLLAFIFLIAGVIAVPIASRLGLGSVLGYLIAGILISPTLNFLGVDVVAVQHFAEFGVVMMLFLIGLELEPKLLWEMRGRLAGLGGGQVIGTAAAIMALAMVLGETWHVALAIGLVLALSSTAIVLQTLNEKGLMRSDGGQASFSVLLFQDIAVIPMLALLPLLAIPELAATADAGHDEGLSLVADLNAWQTALVTLGAIAFVVLGGNYLTRPIFRFIAAAQLRELFTAAALMMIIGIALLMSLVGLSPALGTFLAGVVLANSEYRHELESDIEPFKGLLLGLFFMTVGAGINFALLMDNAGPIIALTLGLIAIKIIVLLVLSMLFNIPGAHRWLFSLGLAQAGEFGFVLLAFTDANGILPTALADKLLLIVALSMLLTPLLFILYDRVIAPRYNREQHREADEIDDISPIIIAGRGRVGGIVDRILESAGYKSTVIDFSSEQLGRLQKFGINAYFGDATRPDLLRSAGVEEAKLLIVAIDDKEQITKLVQYAVHHYPDLHVMARAVDRDHVYALWSVGCRDIIRETYDSSLRMGRSAFEAIGISRETADEMVDIFRDADRKSMIEFADVYDIDIPSWENEALLAKVRQLQEEWEPELREQIIAVRNRDGMQ
ncbi:Kef-type potassium/proton antiporter, CPA2 family [Parasphingorhabdus marina DSM 22363]|uniref:Kef-type potassium/proton antiporter, CPA2 family n=1 Tax=Parasphingorhabdus marina DSM 22363 TaxID=1123272 RepID=A0A1N6EKU1_9SPHN|nr:monovalent cation:proton antiporter-2 (CPA2) family protein [Parasphingorhabdus marina]SIN83672.1 Kef-type potassium/proton antiporter, CPA2 family [Parasphingorhabdus marina DSM 22363]